MPEPIAAREKACRVCGVNNAIGATAAPNARAEAF